jgi:hypothetical protein
MQDWLDQATFEVPNSALAVMGAVLAVGVVAEAVNGGSRNTSHADAQQFWNALPGQWQAGLMQAAQREAKR